MKKNKEGEEVKGIRKRMRVREEMKEDKEKLKGMKRRIMRKRRRKKS